MWIEKIEPFLNKTIVDDVINGLKMLPEASVHCCVTSPPYYGLRDYGTAIWQGGNPDCDHTGKPMRTCKGVNTNTGTGNDVKNTEKREIYKQYCEKCGAARIDMQIGLEDTPEMYINRIVEVFREIRRVLRDDGTVWLNFGDSYAGAGWRNNNDNPGAKQRTSKGTTNISGVIIKTDCKPKDLIGIPWMVAFALRADGWYLRQDIIWHKPNPMPESVTDRCTKSHEYIFLLSKSRNYYYDKIAIMQPIKDETIKRLIQDVKNQKGSYRQQGKTNGPMKAVISGRKDPDIDHTKGLNGTNFIGHKNYLNSKGELIHDEVANKKSVWTVTTKPFKEAHFAVFPQNLIVDCIKAGTSEHGCCGVCGAPYRRMTEKEYKKHENWFGDYQSVRNDRGKAGNSYNELIKSKTVGWKATCKCENNSDISPCVVLDPFMGSGTTHIVARKLYRNAVGIDIQKNYEPIRNKRIEKELGIFQ